MIKFNELRDKFLSSMKDDVPEINIPMSNATVFLFKSAIIENEPAIKGIHPKYE